ncbi:MAG: FAD-binding oxidoreductase [Actinomycetota bacterium]|nr:FAD-binding oxidoreductase [Actinomycetota bacterium]
MALVTASGAEALEGSIAGEVLVPGDPGYDDARSVWNGGIDRYPAVIARCSTADDVAAAIGFGRREGLEISVRGGGHSLAGFAVCDGGLMISLENMRHITVDPAARRARCGGGATWADVDAATQAYGLAVPGGTVSHTGIGGLTVGGGMGWLTRKAGLSCDNLVSAEVVTADGRILMASADEHPDLFWALRGGGGNFGIVTSFEYRLHEVGPIVHLGLFFWGLDQGAEALRLGRDFVATAPDDMGIIIAGLSAPPAPFVPEEHHFAPGYALMVAGFGSAEAHEQAVTPIREALPPLFELVTPMPYTELQQMLDPGLPWGILGYEKGLYLEELTDDAIAVITEHLPRKRSPLSFAPMITFGGAYGRVGEDDTAFGGSRAARFALVIAAVCESPELMAADRHWVRSFWEAVRPHAMGSGSYVNFMAEHDDNRVRASYGPTKYERLARIKAAYDPDNVLHLNANIKPASRRA